MALCLLSERGIGLPLGSFKGKSHVVLREYVAFAAGYVLAPPF